MPVIMEGDIGQSDHWLGIGNNLSFADKARQGISSQVFGNSARRKEVRPYKWTRILFEVSLIFVLTEGLIRRLLPSSMMNPILAVKFGIFPLLYGLLLSGRRAKVKLPAGILLFSLWGAIISLWHGSAYWATTLFGLLVNLTFIPVCLLSRALYPDRQGLRRFFTAITAFAFGAGAVAIYQSFLPSDHWMNVLMDGSAGFDGRVTSTFVFCNVFGNFTMGGTIACLAALGLAKRVTERVFALCAVLTLNAGAVFSGSRAALFGTSAIVTIVLLKSRLRVRYAVLAVLTFVVIASAGSRVSVDDLSVVEGQRAFTAEDFLSRISQEYLGEWLSHGQAVSRGWGTGWGPFTMGLESYTNALDIRESTPSTELEGGYSVMVAETGFCGLVCFLGMHVWLVRSRRPLVPWFGVAVACWSLLGNLPLCLLEVPVLSILFWAFAGLQLAQMDDNSQRCWSGR